MQYTYATSAYHEARFLVHFCLAIWANFEQGDTTSTSSGEHKIFEQIGKNCI